MSEAEETDYIKAIWFVSGRDKDWMATVYRSKGDPTWRFRYRFRYYNGSKDPFDGTDRKSHWSGKDEFGFGAKHICDSMDHLAAMTAKEWRATINERVDVEGPPEKLMDPSLKRSWMHLKKVELQ